MSTIYILRSALIENRSTDNAKAMEAYMKHKFPFLGIKSPIRKAILNEVIKTNKSEIKNNIDDITLKLYQEHEREYHYCAMELYARFKKKTYRLFDFKTIEMLITTHSHWDTVDFIAKHIFGQYLRELPNDTNRTVEYFSKSDNMWLNRSAILFQLGYKELTNKDILFALCDQHKLSHEFFIQKAIGWALREYGKVNPSAVLNFVNETTLKPLSKREAIRRLI